MFCRFAQTRRSPLVPLPERSGRARTPRGPIEHRQSGWSSHPRPRDRRLLPRSLVRGFGPRRARHRRPVPQPRRRRSRLPYGHDRLPGDPDRSRATPGRSWCSPPPTSATTASTPAKTSRRSVHPRAIVVRDHFRKPAHQRADRSLEDVLRRANIPGLSDVDTRALTIALREQRSLPRRDRLGNPRRTRRGGPRVPRDVRDQLRRAGELQERLTTSSPAPKGADVRTALPGLRPRLRREAEHPRTAARGELLRCASTRQASSVDDLLGRNGGPVPDGVFLSNGPGDPALLDPQVETIRGLLESGHPGLRHLPRPPAPVAGDRRRDLQAALRPPRREPPGAPRT